MKRIFALLTILLLMCSTAFAIEVEEGYGQNYGDNEVIYDKDGKIWIGPDSAKDKTQGEIDDKKKKEKPELVNVDAVKRMEDYMKGNLKFRRPDGNTNCAWTIAWAYKGTPYGQNSEYKDAFEAQEHGYSAATGNINVVGQLMYIANKNNQLITDVDTSKLKWNDNVGDLADGGGAVEDGGYNPYGAFGYTQGPFHDMIENYKPQPGDIGVTSGRGGGTWHFGHVYMIRAKEDGTLGTIENGGNYSEMNINDDDGYETRLPRTTAWIRASDYANAFAGDFFKNIYNMGKALAVIMEKFAELCEEGITYLKPHMIYLFWLMAIIDLAMSIMLAGFEINPFNLIVRFLKYGFFYFLIFNWATLVDDFFLSLSFDTSNAVDMVSPSVSLNITNPQLVLQKGLLIIKPGLDYVGSLPWSQRVLHAMPCLMVIVSSLITIFFLMAVSIYVAISYIEFYVIAALAMVTLPYTPSGFTKFMPQASLAAVWKQTIKLLVIAIMIGLLGMIMAENSPILIAEAMARNGLKLNSSFLSSLLEVLQGNTHLFQGSLQFMGICANMVMMTLITMTMSQKIAQRLAPSSTVNW